MASIYKNIINLSILQNIVSEVTNFFKFVIILIYFKNFWPYGHEFEICGHMARRDRLALKKPWNGYSIGHFEMKGVQWIPSMKKI